MSQIGCVVSEGEDSDDNVELNTNDCFSKIAISSQKLKTPNDMEIEFEVSLNISMNIKMYLWFAVE